MTDDGKHPPFEIFRASEATDYAEATAMDMAPMTEVQMEGMGRLFAGGIGEGSQVSLLYSRPGMSLTYVWFKSGYPLPLHSHSTDCLYFIISGSLKIGNEELGPGDGFFLGTDVPYTYVPGENGVELMEFRTADKFDVKSQAKGKSYWDKQVANLAAARERWPSEKTAPSGIKVG
jgi:hypothetical protein